MLLKRALLGAVSVLIATTSCAFAQGHGGFTPNGQGGDRGHNDDFYGGGGGHHGGGGGGNKALQWRGRVDDMTDISIRAGRVQFRTVSGKTTSDVDYHLRRELPKRNANVSVSKLKGRGTVYVLQQPRSNNDYTAVLRIVDKDGGADDYRFNAQW